MVFSLVACGTGEGATQGDNVTNVSTDDEVKLNNVIGDGSLTITEKFNSVEVTVDHPDITADFLENGNRVYVRFPTNNTKYEIRMHSNREEFFSTIDLLDENDYFDISHMVQDGSITFTGINMPFDITTEPSVTVMIGSDSDWGELYNAQFDQICFNSIIR